MNESDPPPHSFAGFVCHRQDELLKLRCAATECVGHVALAVGAQQFTPFLQPTVDAVLQGLTLDLPELRE